MPQHLLFEWCYGAEFYAGLCTHLFPILDSLEHYFIARYEKNDSILHPRHCRFFVVRFSENDETEAVDQDQIASNGAQPVGQFSRRGHCKTVLNKADYEASKNHIGNKNSDSKGLVVFSDLEEKVYYLNVEKGEANNFDAATQTDTLKASKTNKVKVIITE